MKSNSKAVVATAKQINEQHRLAIQSAENAIEHAILCGQMLVEKKASLAHGELQPWIEKNCEFAYSTAARYMKAAQSSKAVNLSALSHIFPSGKTNKLDKVQISTAVEICEKTAAEKAPFSASQNDHLAPEAASIQPPKVQAVPPSILSDDWQPEIPGDEEMAAIEREVQEAEARVLQADDITAGYHAELKRQAAEIAVLKVSRDGYMHGKNQITKMLQAEQRKTARLEKELERIRGSQAA